MTCPGAAPEARRVGMKAKRALLPRFNYGKASTPTSRVRPMFVMNNTRLRLVLLIRMRCLSIKFVLEGVAVVRSCRCTG